LSPTSPLTQSLELHDSAAETFAELAAAIPAEPSDEPLDEGKWSLAELVDHLISTYDILISELDGAAGMQVRTSLWQRFVLRLTLMPRILAGRGFPKGAPAPRETRPVRAGLGRDEGLTMFRERAAQLRAAAMAAPPRGRLTHAYFGSASVAKGVRLCARHIEHHRAQLPSGF